MRTFWKAAAIALALGAAATTPACAQVNDDRYYGNDSASGYPPAPDGYYGDDGYYQGAYDGSGYGNGYYAGGAYGAPYADSGYYGTDAYGYCDEYGCPDDYWDMPIYYGPVFYNDAWFYGPLYYRDWGGRRQFWIHGGWRYDGWAGPRPSWYREGRYGPALGLNWYRTNRVYRQGWHGGGNYRTYRAPAYGAPNRFGTPPNRFQTNNGWYSGGSAPGYRGRGAWQGNDNRQNWRQPRDQFRDQSRDQSGNSGFQPRNWNGGRGWSQNQPSSSSFQSQGGGGRNWGGGGRSGGGGGGGGGGQGGGRVHQR